MSQKCKICHLPEEIVKEIELHYYHGFAKTAIVAKFKELKGLYHSLHRHLLNHYDEEEVERRLKEEDQNEQVCDWNVRALKEDLKKTPEELAQDAYYEQYKVQPIEPDEEWCSPVTGKVPRVKEAYDYASMAPRLLK